MSNANEEMAAEEDETLLDSGLICDFAPRPDPAEEEPDAQDVSTGGNGMGTKESPGIGGALRRGTSNVLNRMMGGGKRQGGSRGAVGCREGAEAMEVEPAAAAAPAKKTKPRRRRGSHMPEAAAAKTSAAPLEPSPMDIASAVAVKKTTKPRRRRGSDMMTPGAAASYTACAPKDPLDEGRSEFVPSQAAAAPSPAAATAAKSKPRRRRGSDMMPSGAAAAYTASSPKDPLDGQSEFSPPSSDAMPAQGQMQNITVASSHSDSVHMAPPAAESPEAPLPDSPPGRTRMKRRGSVVKTLLETGPRDVDGDGQHVAKASTSSVSEGYGGDPICPEELLDNRTVKYASDNQHLPQRRQSDEMGGDAHKRPMLYQRSASEYDSGREGSGRRGRKKRDIGRKAIRATGAGDIEYEHKVIPKSKEAKEMIYDAITPNILFRACSPEELVDLVDAFAPQYVAKGSVVIREGDEGDHFYVMERGIVDIFEREAHKCSLHSGVAFGEIALLYSCPRTATVIAKDDSKLWVIDRRAFRGITAQHKKRRLELKVEFIRKVKIEEKYLGEILKPSEINSMALATTEEKFPAGSNIVRQGEPGDAFYMIEEGSVDVFIAERGDRPIVTLKDGAFFGEKALLSSDVRTATCVASTDVQCLLLMRKDFVLMLGNLQDLLDRSYIARSETRKAEQDGMQQKELQPAAQRFDMKDFDIKRTLGFGAFGFVKLVRWKLAPVSLAQSEADSYYALKCVSKERIKKAKQQEKIKREESIMKSLIHPFIARCYSVMEDERGKYFLMEALCGGELCELLYHETQFSEEWSRFYSAAVLAAFEHMHQRKIAYRDLKPENLVLDTVGYVKIVDFGLAKVINSGQTYTFCGTPDYLAPEVILNEGYDWAVDFWGLGVLVYEMTAGVAPFYAETPMETYEKALSGHVHIPGHFSHAVASLIKKLLHPSQSKRMGRTVGGATAVKDQPWYNGFDWDSLMEYNMPVPYVPDARHPDDNSSSVSMDGDEAEGFATAFF